MSIGSRTKRQTRRGEWIARTSAGLEVLLPQLLIGTLLKNKGACYVESGN